MKRILSYTVSGLAAASLIAAFLIAGSAEQPQETLSIRVQPLQSVQPVTEITVQTKLIRTTQTIRTTKTTAASTAAVTEKYTETVFSSEITLTTTETTAETAEIRDLNAADNAALLRVEGIGENLAAGIIRYRAAVGGFVRRPQLTEISGIGETLMNRIMQEFEIADELPPETTAPPEMTEPPETSSAETVLPSETTATTEKALPVPQNLNEVGREALMEIPDMTEQLADEILRLRESVEGFQTVYELCVLDGITEQFVTERICPYLYIENDTYLNAMKKQS